MSSMRSDEIVAVRSRIIGYSQAPSTLRRNLVTNTSLFDDFDSKPGGWMGPAFCTLVEVETRGGARGAATAGAFNGAAQQIIDDYLVDVVLGQSVRQHELLWQRMYRTTVRFGRRGPAVSGLSAIDLAAWDAHGITDGRSVIDLLGGPAQSSVPCYVSRLYALEDLEALADEARGYIAQGFTRLKQRFGFGPADGREGIQRNIDLIRTVREAVGDLVELAADAYMGWDRAYAAEMAERLREYRLSWIEEPLMPHDTAGYAELRRRVPWQRWSFGEHSYTKWDFAEIIDAGASDIVQPDMNRAGGVTEGRKIAALAEVSGLPLVPHSNEAHNLAITFSQGAHVCPIVEYFPDVQPDTGNELFWRLFDGNPVAVGGCLSAPAGPGLGVTVNEDAVSELLVHDGGWIRR
ncbi:MAG: enolase C-terminal domain-like protein [Microcella sp.]|uniref:enolase C-terminal domain-like protein n=1 Tax=Microcella sp. TaxID=1913979 RepID=UPI0033162C8E